MEEIEEVEVLGQERVVRREKLGHMKADFLKMGGDEPNGVRKMRRWREADQVQKGQALEVVRKLRSSSLVGE